MSIETTVTLFKDTDTSRQVLKELYVAGFRNEFWIFGDSSDAWGNEAAGTNPMTSSKTPVRRRDDGSRNLTRLGVPEEEAQAYMNDVGARRGAGDRAGE